METFKINMNEELNGVELTFSQKPDTRILTTLKDAGFRWHRVKKVWYAKRSETTLQVIAELKRRFPLEQYRRGPKATDVGQKKENLDGVKVGDLYVLPGDMNRRNLSFFQVVKISAHNAWFIEVAPESKKKVMQRGVLGQSPSGQTEECLRQSISRHSSKTSCMETGKARKTELSK